MKALRGIKVEHACRGPVSFDDYGNVVGNVYIRKVERKEGRLVNSVIYTYPDVEPVLDLQARRSSSGIRCTRATGRRRRTSSPDRPARTGGREQGSVRDALTMQFWVIQTLNSLALGGLLFLLVRRASR